MPFAAAKRSRRYQRSCRPRVLRKNTMLMAARAAPITTIGRTAPKAPMRNEPPMSPDPTAASELMIEPMTVRNTEPKMMKNAAPTMVATIVADEPNIDPAAPLCLRRRAYSRTALRSTGSTSGRGSNGTDAAGELTGSPRPSSP